MSNAIGYKVGTIVSADLTVPDASGLRDFYEKVVGWTFDGLDMGGYQDYMLKTSDGADLVGGLCHARGGNAGLPPVWLVYVNVDDIDASARRCEELGGTVLVQNDDYAVIRDPAGAVMAITHEADAGGA